MRQRLHLNILGTRGIPAAHGGFETFAERLALFLVSRGVSVTVYCQSDDPLDRDGREDDWHGVHRVHFCPSRGGVAGTMQFDLASARHVLGQPGHDLVLGYNTAVFNVLQRLAGRQVYMNMDGVEWKRKKWSAPAKLWLFLNEVIGSNISTAPIADHPEIARHVEKRCRHKAIMIPYGADIIGAASDAPVRELGLVPGRYFISIARVEPENSILEIVRAHRAAETDTDLAVLGRLDPDNAYHRAVRAAGGNRTLYPGAIYDGETVRSLRFHARGYMHGHQVGGTNPSLVEALGAGNAVIAHDNSFNRWTAGEDQRFFSDTDSCAEHIRAFAGNDLIHYTARMGARQRHARDFRWTNVLASYETLIFGSAAGAVQIAAE
jgi:glycosyltransferase involved in cell wall biosynthesis